MREPEGWAVSITVDYVQPRSSVMHGVGFPLNGVGQVKERRLVRFPQRRMPKGIPVLLCIYHSFQCTANQLLPKMNTSAIRAT